MRPSGMNTGSGPEAALKSVVQRFWSIREGRDLSRGTVRALDAIHEMLFDPQLNVQSIKLRCHIPDNNISSRFKHEVGMSMKDYIDALRLDVAHALLFESRHSVFHVSQVVGYNHPQTFYRVFERKFGRTPGSARAATNQPAAVDMNSEGKA